MALFGPVFLDEWYYSAVDVPQGQARIGTSNAQVGGPLQVLPIRFQLVLVTKFVKQKVKRLLVKHCYSFEFSISCRGPAKDCRLYYWAISIGLTLVGPHSAATAWPSLLPSPSWGKCSIGGPRPPSTLFLLGHGRAATGLPPLLHQVNGDNGNGHQHDHYGQNRHDGPWLQIYYAVEAVFDPVEEVRIGRFGVVGCYRPERRPGHLGSVTIGRGRGRLCKITHGILAFFDGERREGCRE